MENRTKSCLDYNKIQQKEITKIVNTPFRHILDISIAEMVQLVITYFVPKSDFKKQ